VKPQNSSNSPGSSNTAETKSSSEAGFSGETFLKEFQSRIFGLLFTQNKMLTDLKEKNDVLQDTLACLINEINTLKTSVKQRNQEPAPLNTPINPLANHQFIGNSAETITVDNLLTFLYGPKPDFQYQLVLKSDLALPLYRERNFKFTVMLTDKNGNLVQSAQRIPLTIGLYSSENPPKFIDLNTAGNKILKGFVDKQLVNGSVTFDKIQIKEVTSHFRNGWIFLVVYPKTSSNSINGMNGQAISCQNIKPLVLEKVVVKAKKAKEKDQANENEDKQNDFEEEDAEETTVKEESKMA